MASAAKPAPPFAQRVFGGPFDLSIEDTKAGLGSPETDFERIRTRLSRLADGKGALRMFRPQPTAAFAPRDLINPAYPAAEAAAKRLGFAPVARGAGGQLAVYGAEAMVIDLVAPHPSPRDTIQERFLLFAEALVFALTSLGVDARLGEVPGEYCPGTYSVNAGGRIKLAGLAQRVQKTGYHLGAVIALARSDATRSAVTELYSVLDLPFEVSTFGGVADFRPDLGDETVFLHIAETVATALQTTALKADKPA